MLKGNSLSKACRQWWGSCSIYLDRCMLRPFRYLFIDALGEQKKPDTKNLWSTGRGAD